MPEKIAFATDAVIQTEKYSYKMVWSVRDVNTIDTFLLSNLLVNTGGVF